jgi:phosphate transport system protein
MTVRTHYEENLKKLNQGIVELGTWVEGAVRKALTALLRQDTDLAEGILREDPEISRRQLEMEDQVITLIATEQPVARDLRELMGAMKLASNLERIGDHAVHLAEATLRHAGQSYLPEIKDLEQMAGIGIEMLHNAVTAFIQRDPAGARAVAARDDEIDVIHDAVVKKLLQTMQSDPTSINQAITLLTLTRFLERLGDHVASICEWIVYGIEGRHEKLK